MPREKRYRRPNITVVAIKRPEILPEFHLAEPTCVKTCGCVVAAFAIDVPCEQEPCDQYNITGSVWGVVVKGWAWPWR